MKAQQSVISKKNSLLLLIYFVNSVFYSSSMVHLKHNIIKERVYFDSFISDYIEHAPFEWISEIIKDSLHEIG